jgi:6-phosphofructokinase 1
LRVLAVPKTIRNDIEGTDRSIGFDSTVDAVVEMIDRVRTTAESHDRVMVAEVTGRDTGWIALSAGFASGADVIVIPEIPVSVHDVCGLICSRHDGGANYSVIVIAEGATLILAKGIEKRCVDKSVVDEFGQPTIGGIGEVLADAVRGCTDFETRVSVLGHLQRGGTPSPGDRILGRRFGMAAADFVHRGLSDHAVALRGDEIVAVPLSDIADRIRTVPASHFGLARQRRPR